MPITLGDTSITGLTGLIEQPTTSDNTIVGPVIRNFATGGSTAGIYFQGYDWVQGGIWHGRGTTGNNRAGALVLGTNPNTTDLTKQGLVGRAYIDNGGGFYFTEGRIYEGNIENKVVQFVHGTINRRVRISMSNYGVAKISLYAARSNGGPSFVWWEGVVGNHNNASESAASSTRASGGSMSYSFNSSSAGVFNWDINNSGSDGVGFIRAESIYGGGGTISITTY